VFIFGGPGTQKGKYIDCLADLYGLRCITICQVLEEELSGDQVYQMKSQDMTKIAIHDVMGWFVRRMRRTKDAPGFVLDIVPNVRVTNI